MKKLIDYVRVITTGKGLQQIVNQETSSYGGRDGTASTIDGTETVYYFDDGVAVKYIHEVDDGAPYPGAKFFWHNYEIIETGGFEFESETDKSFLSNSEILRWLETP